VAADRQHGPPVAGLGSVLAPGPLPPGDIDLQAAPTERAPEQWLDHPDRLHPAPRDGLRSSIEETGAETEPVGRLRHGEPVVAVEAPPEGGEQAESHSTAAPDDGQGGARRDGVGEDEPDQQESGDNAQPAQQDRHDEAIGAH